MRASLLTGLAAVVIVAGLLALNHVTIPISLRHPTDTKRVEVDRGTHYRLTVKLAYKGEPVDFDIVVGCRVRIRTYTDNDRTVEVGIAPIAYGRKMPDGRGIVVVPPQACDGETTANGRVPPGLLPFVITFENADEPWFGLGYASDDAYDSPRSELAFLGATIAQATREEWEEWRRTEAPKNLVTYDLLGINGHDMWDKVRWTPGRRVMPDECRSFARVKVDEAARELLRAYWPESRPNYWYPNDALRLALHKLERKDDSRTIGPFEGHGLEDYGVYTSRRGQPRRTPGAVIARRVGLSGTIYPARTDLNINLLLPDGSTPKSLSRQSKWVWAEAELTPNLRGFAYCDINRNLAGEPSVDPSVRFANRINGEPINDDLHRVATNFDIAFERDEHAVLYRVYGPKNIFGGL